MTIIRSFPSGLVIFCAMLLVVASPSQGGTSASASAVPALTKDTLIIRSGKTDHPFTVELARTEEQKIQGLMFRKSMSDDAGMLFDLEETSVPRMWMKNTLIPLDMLFIAADGTLAYIRHNIRPLSLEAIEPPMPVRYVLEIKGGLTAELGIKEGDKLVHFLPLSAR